MHTFDGIHEVFEGDVKYPYADVGAQALLHISSVTPDNRRDFSYICPYCRKALSPRLGKKNAHCFAHKKGESCEMDRYIHKTAEMLLKQKWDNPDEPFEITMTVHTDCKEAETCVFYREGGRGCNKDETKTYDLKKQFSQCLVEKKYGEFVPDLCLIDETGKHEPIFIEIWSKHKNSEKKADSKYRIIEIRIKTPDELKELVDHPIIESETVTFSHFKTFKKAPTEKDGTRLMKYILYADSLKAFVDDRFTNCSNYRNRHGAKSIFEVVCSLDEVYRPQHFRSYCNAIAIDRGYDIRSCYLCQLYGPDTRNKKPYEDWDFDPNRLVGCRREIETSGLIQCVPEEARTCPQFKLKDMPLKKAKMRFSNVNRYIWIRNSDGTTAEETHKRKTFIDDSDSFDN